MKKIICILFIIVLCGLNFSQGGILENTNMSGSFGSVIVNGKIYNQLALRPEIVIGKLGIGLDIYLYIDSDGNIYQNSWDFSDGTAIARTILDKVLYVRWAQPGDPFYFRAGALPYATLGHGILVNRYSNMIDYPSFRRIGLDLKAKFSTLQLEYIQSDFKHTPGMTGVRLATPFFGKANIGVSFVTDMDQFAGLIDSDGDNVPDVFDDLPDDADYYDQSVADKYDTWLDVYSFDHGGDSTGFSQWFNTNPGIPRNSYSKDQYSGDTVSGMAVDLSYQLNPNLQLYSEFGQLIGETTKVNNNSNSLGYGLVPLGLYYHFGFAQLQAEYRIASRNFLFNYWDQSYDVNRATIQYINGNDSIFTKESQLYRYGKTAGFYTHLSLALMNVIDLGFGYQDMQGKIWSDSDADYIDDNNKTFLSTASLNTSFIPKVKKAVAFYQQSNIPNPFDFKASSTTVFGYDVGIEVSSGVMIIYKARTTYVMGPDGNLDPVHSMQFETQVIF